MLIMVMVLMIINTDDAEIDGWMDVVWMDGVWMD